MAGQRNVRDRDAVTDVDLTAAGVRDENIRREERDAAKRDANPDPITGEPGSHPVGTGVGTALGGAAAGAAGGAIGGPLGAAIGAVVGGVAGGLAGKGVAENIDPTVEDEYWRSHYQDRGYFSRDRSYDTVRPAYQYGWESRASHADRRFDEVEADLAREWPEHAGQSDLTWDEARPATRDAWDRLDSTPPPKV